MKKRDWLVGIVAFLAVFAWFYKPWEYFLSSPPPVPIPPVVVEEPDVIEFIEFEGEAKTPVRLAIAALEVDTFVVGVGVTSQGDMDTTKEPYGIAWYTRGASPGWKGNALLAGHNYWNGIPGSFVILSYLPPGEEVLITYADGSIGRFQVISNDTYELDEIPASVMSLTGETRTTLISCNGKRLLNGGYSQRTIVILKAQGIDPPEN